MILSGILQGVESRTKENKETFRYERDVKSKVENCKMFKSSHSKDRIITKKSVNSVMNERQLLSQLKHPYDIPIFLPITSAQIFSKYDIRVPGSRESLSGDGFAGWRGP